MDWRQHCLSPHHRHRSLTQGDILEGTADAGGRDLVGGKAREIPSRKDDLALIWEIDATDEIDEGRFASTIGTDNGPNLPLAHLQAQVA